MRRCSVTDEGLCRFGVNVSGDLRSVDSCSDGVVDVWSLYCCDRATSELNVECCTCGSGTDAIEDDKQNVGVVVDVGNIVFIALSANSCAVVTDGIHSGQHKFKKSL